MSKSILQDKSKRQCYLCMLLYDNDSRRVCIEEHHVFGGPNRKKSEHYGLKIYLDRYHHTGDITGSSEAIHMNKKYDLMVKQIAQREFEKRYGHEKFMAVFGKNYIPEEEWSDGGEG